MSLTTADYEGKRLRFNYPEEDDQLLQFMWDGEMQEIPVTHSIRSLAKEDVPAYLRDHMYIQSSLGPDWGGASAAIVEGGRDAIHPILRSFTIAKNHREEALANIKSLLDAMGEEGAESSKARDELEPDDPRRAIRGATPEGLGSLLMNLWQYAYSPVSGVTRGIVGEPVGALAGEGAEALGASEDVAWRIRQFAENFGTYAAEFFTPTAYLKLIQSMMPAGQVLKGFAGTLAGKPHIVQAAPVAANMDEFLAKGGDETGTAVRELDEFGYPIIKPKPAPTTYGSSSVGPSVPAGEGRTIHLAKDPIEDITTDAGLLERLAFRRARAGDDKQRLYRDVGDELKKALIDKEVGMGNIVRILDDLEIPLDEFFKVTVRDSAIIMNLMSQMAKKIAKDGSIPPSIRRQLQEVSDQFDKTGKITNPQKVMNGWRKLENFRRGFLVSQLGTAARNFISQAGRLSISFVDDMLQGAIRGTTGRESLKNVWDSATSDLRAFRLLNPFGKDRKAFNAILDGQPLTKDMLMNKSVHEVQALNKITSAVNTMNIWQERVFRRMAFQAKLSKLLKEGGQDFHTIDHSMIPPKMIDEAMEHALEITFARTGTGLGRDLVRIWEKFPVLYQINPFPRFAFSNALPFLAEHSPWGLLKAFSPRTLADLASGNPRRFAKSASRGMLGTALLAKAMELRNGPDAGDKWYELKVGEPDENGVRKTIDVRYYAPLSTYLFFAEAMKGPDNWNLKKMDFVEAAIGINRLSGTGLIFIDYLQSKSEKVTANMVQKYVGNYFSFPTIPLKQLKDFYDAWEYEDYKRTTNIDVEKPWTFATLSENMDRSIDLALAPTAANIPGLSQDLPLSRSPLRVGGIPIGEPVEIFGVEIHPSILKQIPAINIKQKNVVEQEVDRLGLDFGVYMPRTGSKQTNRIMSQFMAPFVMHIIPDMLKTDDSFYSIVDRFIEDGVRPPTEGAVQTLFRNEGVDTPYKEFENDSKKLALRMIFTFIKEYAKAEWAKSKDETAQDAFAKLKESDDLTAEQLEYLRKRKREKRGAYAE